MSAARGTLMTMTLAAAMFAAAASEASRSVDDLVAELNSLAGQAGDDWVRIGGIRTGGLSRGQEVRIPLTLHKDACYRFLAVGGSGIADLDLRLFSSGRLLAGDQGVVTRPEIEHCADRDRQAEARLRVGEGTGQYAFGVWARAEGAEPLLSQQESAALAALARLTDEVGAGSEPLGQPVVARVGHRQSHGWEVLLEGARCYRFLAAGDQGIGGITLTVNDGDEEVAGDRISGNRPVIHWCAPRRIRVQVKALVTGGSGAVAMGVLSSQAAALHAPERVGGTETDFIANRLRQIHAQQGKGRAAITGVMRGNLGTTAEQVFEVRLNAGRCYTVIAVGSPSVRNIDISLLDREGREIQKDDTAHGFSVLDTSPCPSFTGQYGIRIRMTRGAGHFGVQVFSD